MGLSCTLPMQAQSVKQREISKRAEANPEDTSLCACREQASAVHPLVLAFG